MAKQIDYGFVQLSNKVRIEIHKKTKNHSGNCIAVYLALLSQVHRRKDDNYTVCCPSVKAIAEETYIGITTVKSTLKILRENGFIQYSSGTINIANRYFFPFESFYEDSKKLQPLAFQQSKKIKTGGFDR